MKNTKKRLRNAGKDDDGVIKICAFADEADKTVKGQIDALRRCGIGLLEIRGVDGNNVSELTPGEAKEIRKRLDDAGISIFSVGSPIGKVEIRDPFAPHFDLFLRTLETAQILGAEKFRLFSFYHTGIEETSALLDEVTECLSRFLERSAGSGIELCHENEKSIYGDTAARCAELHRALPDLGAVFDPANFAACGEDPAAAYRLLADNVSYLHIKDIKKDGTVVPAGEGIGQIPMILADYRKRGGGVVTLEPHLAVFDGFAALEKAEDRTKIASYRYASANEAFDAAHTALKNLLEKGENDE